MINNPILQSVVGSALFALLSFIVNICIKYFFKHKMLNKLKNIIVTTQYIYITSILITLSLQLFYTIKTINIISIILSISISNILILYFYFYKFSTVGLVNCDISIKKGFSYKNTIDACETDFCFLGVGARKLTLRQDEFEKMVERVNKHGKQVQLLLCHHESESLHFLATRAGKSPDDYSYKVKSSIEYLAKLVTEKDYNIEVRFYHSRQVHEMPIFRIALINNFLCLVSYTQFNDSSHEGELMPQIHFNKLNSENNSKSFYFAFESYFKSLWDKNEQNTWNPTDLE